jgi:ankyrin repeat protein
LHHFLFISKFGTVVDHDAEDYIAPNQDLFYAISAQDIALVEQLLNSIYTDTDALDMLENSDDYNALHHAVASDDVEIVKMLLDHGMNPDFIMHNAVENAAYQVLEYLLVHENDLSEQRNDEGMSSYELAAFNGDIHSVSLFKKYNALVTSHHYGNEGIGCGCDDILEPVNSAADNGDFEMIKYLIEEVGLPADDHCNYSSTPLFRACMNNYIDIARYLVEKHHAYTSWRFYYYETYNDPLKVAIGSNDLDWVKFVWENRMNFTGC